MRRIALALVLVPLVAASQSSAQCPDWSPTFHSPGVEGSVIAMTVFDDGTGPALFFGGTFTYAGDVKARNVVRFDGASWSPLGTGTSSQVNDFAVFDDGTGAALYATGSFPKAGGLDVFGVAKWDGAAWSPLDTGLDSGGQALAVFDDGTGPALYVGGSFDSASGVPASCVARWNGSSWSSVGAGLPATVFALAVFDDGSGPALFAGTAQSASSALMKWDGASWSDVGVFAPFNSSITALVVHDDGAGAALYAGGSFTAVDGATASNVAMWDGSTWSALGAGIAAGNVNALASFGGELYAGGSLTSAGGAAVTGIARWDGANWSDVAGGTSGSVVALGTFDLGGGARLWAGGAFDRAGSIGVRSVAAWDGASWANADASGHGLDAGFVAALATIDDGTGAALYAGGYFTRAGTALVEGFARWNGTSWSAVGSGLGTVQSIGAFDDGSGVELHVGTSNAALKNFARWDGSTWSTVGGGVSMTGGGPATVTAMTVFDDGSGDALFVGGTFLVAGGVSAKRIAKWDGASWSALDSGLSGVVDALAVFDDGTGPALYAAGNFINAGGASALFVAKWDGASWSQLGSGLSARAQSLAVFDDGSGPALYVGGNFATASGVSVGGIAKWDGASWSALGTGVLTGVAESVYALASFDDGTGPALFAAGYFKHMDGLDANGIARWSGAAWSTLGDGLESSSTCRALSFFADGASPHGSLYAGGEFDLAGGAPSFTLARWTDTCACSGTSYCTSGTTSSGCEPVIAGIGRASASAPSGFEIRVTGVEGDKTGYIVYSVTGPNANPWGASSHFLCVKAPTQRTGTQQTGGTGGQCDGVLSIDWNAYVAAHPLALGVPFSSGASVWAQGYFRDPPGPKTTALSNGLQFSVCP